MRLLLKGECFRCVLSAPRHQQQTAPKPFLGRCTISFGRYCSAIALWRILLRWKGALVVQRKGLDELHELNIEHGNTCFECNRHRNFFVAIEQEVVTQIHSCINTQLLFCGMTVYVPLPCKPVQYAFFGTPSTRRTGELFADFRRKRGCNFWVIRCTRFLWGRVRRPLRINSGKRLDIGILAECFHIHSGARERKSSTDTFDIHPMAHHFLVP